MRARHRFVSRAFLFFAAIFLLLHATSARAVDFCNGVMTALPVPQGKAIAIDGELSDWDLSAQEPVYISASSAPTMNAQWAVMYDDDALYISAQVTMPGRGINNPYNPQDAFWSGDILQVRMCSDPATPYPLDRNRDVKNNRVLHLSFWQNHQTGVSYVNINRGTNLNLGQTNNPPGAQVVIKDSKGTGYALEARLPWSVLDVPEGKNPFKAGDATAFTAETLWIGGDKARTILCYRTNPGAFAFHSPQAWGQLKFAATSPGQRVRPTMAQVLAETARVANAVAPKIGVPFIVNVPEDGLKVSVNIVKERGAVIREILGGEAHPKGELQVRWDGRDAFGYALDPGNYRWAAYFHKPLQAEYQGGVGSSGNPFYQTLDGRGGWGGDHSNPIAVATQGEHLYMLWPVAEAGRPLIKTDLKGHVIWRKNPFVGGGFGPFFAVAANETHVYLVRSGESGTVASKGSVTANLVRLDAATGALQTWGDSGPSELPICKANLTLIPKPTTPMEQHEARNEEPYPAGMTLQPDNMGLAVLGDQVFLSSYALDKIFVIDGLTGSITGELNCPKPRGIAIAPSGDLFAVSFAPNQFAQVLRFVKAAGQAQPVITTGLEAPYGVAVAQDGRIFVSDLGASQQVKVFSTAGKLVHEIGNRGGRAYQGAYDARAITFLKPAGLTLDLTGALVVVECSAPKVFSRIDTTNDQLLDRWFGPGIYWNATWPMPDDARNVFYMLTGAVGRARLLGEGKTSVPNAVWEPDAAGFEHAGNLEDSIPHPEIVKASNGEYYFVKDTIKHPVFLLKNDVLRPVATWKSVSAREKTNTLKKPYLEAWIDRNADGLVQEGETTNLTQLSDGSPLPEIASGACSMHMEPNGDLYFTTHQNVIVKIPARGFTSNGMIDWDMSKTALAVPRVVPGLNAMSTGYREGLLGVRLDAQGNLYTLFNTRLKGGTGTFDFPNTATATRMCEGMGHSSRFNVVKFAKFAPDGTPLWFAGRKATAGAAPGEMYHFWNMAGLVNDKYIAGGSEWGQIYLYTHDGFFVDALMNNPGDITPPGPYTFGGETSGGRVAYFADTGELWAYSSGMAYKVHGFSRGAVEGESRAQGSVTLDKVYEITDPGATPLPDPLQVVALRGSPVEQATWKDVPASVLIKSGQPLAKVQLGYDKNSLAARIEVTDESPLQNDATEAAMVFKQGDTAGFVIGPMRETDRDKPGPGDVRFMAVQFNGQPRVIAMKPFTQGPKKPFEYFTPAAGRWVFEFVDAVPGAQVRLEKTSQGYVAMFSVPRDFVEFKLEPSVTLRGDVEVRLSGAGQRGLQAVSRNYLFTPSRPETTMVDDVPTEARMYPQFWGPVQVK